MFHELLSTVTAEVGGSGVSSIASLDNYNSTLSVIFTEDNLPPTIAFFHSRASQYAIGAALTLWVYDFFLTLALEVELFWQRRDKVMVNILYLMVSFSVCLDGEWVV